MVNMGLCVCFRYIVHPGHFDSLLVNLSQFSTNTDHVLVTYPVLV